MRAGAASKGQDGGAVRVLAAQVIARVLRGQLLDTALERALSRSPGARPEDRALLQELTYGTLRWFHQLQEISARLLERPLKKKDQDIFALLLAGLYQLRYMRLRHYAAVSETVSAAAGLGKSWAGSLINACLRAYLRRQKESGGQDIGMDEAGIYSHPAWLLDEFRRAWPNDWRAIADANNRHPPMTLRVNLKKIARDAYLAMLVGHGMRSSPVNETDCGVELERPVPVTRLPGFADGLVSVQDGAAQLAAILLDVRPGQRVLDACAAPGGKTGHILERCPDLGALVALDKEAARLELVRQNLSRLGLKADLRQGDAADPRDWWDGRPFGRILVDAPCSATGVIRRHPDIKVHRAAEDMRLLERLQARILDALWPLLKTSGKLLYATCSVLPGENENQIQEFLARHRDASEVALSGCSPRPLAAGRPRPPGRQILPGEGGMDGFYYACVQKG